MSQQKNRIIWSVLLILAGLFLFFNNFGIFGDTSDLFLAGAFATGGLIGWSCYLKKPTRWWLIFPSCIFLGISGVIGVDALHFLPHFIEGGSIMLFCLSLAFWVTFATQDKGWWAAIPAGILTTLSFFIMVDMPSLLFLGMGLTFGLLWLIRGTNNTAWAKWPAIGLLGFSLFISMVDHISVVWPLIFITVGSGLLIKNLANNRQNKVANS